MKWAGPAMLNAASTFLCMWMLHIGTYYYVHQMVQWEATYELRVPQLPLNYTLPMSMGLTPANVSFGSLNDPVAQSLGYEAIDISILDKIAALFPCLFVVLAVITDDLGCWTRVLICNSLLALGKGAFGCMTIMPDSAGWGRCKERLKDTGIAWMSQEHSLWDIFKLEMFGTEDGRLRWCGDMMWSGHTYFTCLYALGVLELARDATLNMKPSRRLLILWTIALLGMIQQGIEIYYVLLNRFHYTSDVVMAVLLTFVFYTSGAVAVLSKSWKTFLVTWPWVHDEGQVAFPAYYMDSEDNMDYWNWALDSSGDIFVPPCCSPKCKPKRGYVFTDKQIFNILKLAFDNKMMDEQQIERAFRELKMKRKPWKKFVREATQLADSTGSPILSGPWKRVSPLESP
eukprot:gnl/TRDRNA2_/TRDRNA2_127774_c0_seq1.p1 gnl/TRDRNA2_/TRDRNA2_127774_c0~~gnl/TRDRNA2_/TRDRNA2_127774_c0_seq1.p1  ORF type:complete len:434 (+),score=57.50 gnl/TRDRNA2_/TRDRNA2_127774_c0_seq1:104-1303(+)